MQVVDCHHHIGTTGTPRFDASWGDADMTDRLDGMRKSRVDSCLLLPAPRAAGGFRNFDHAQMNDSVAACAGRWTGSVVGSLCTVNPAEPSESVHEARRAIDELGMDGVVFHHRFLGMDIDDDRVIDFVRRSSSFLSLVFVHVYAASSFEAPWRLTRLAAQFSDIAFVALDAMSMGPQSSFLRHCAADLENLSFDTGAMASAAHGLEPLLGAVGADRILFGSDTYSGSPHFNTVFPLQELEASQMSDAELTAVLGGNLHRMLAG